MRLSMVLLLTGALAWGCSSDEEGVNEPVAQEGTGEEASLAGTALEGAPPADSDVAAGADTTGGADQGQEGAWQETTEGAPSAAVEAANDLKEGDKEAGDSYSVTAFVLNVRKGPGKEHAKTRTLRKGETVSALERSGTWVRIGEQEWVSSSYLTK